MLRLKGVVVFRVGLVLMILAFFAALWDAYEQEQSAPLTLMRWFKGERQQRLRYVEFSLTTQNPREPLFEGTVLVNLEDSDIPANLVTARIRPMKNYAPSVVKLNF